MRRRTVTTLQDVAREVGVSAMTVSVVLNGARSATRVSPDTRARILDAATRLRYRPNGAARGLQRRRMETIGVIAIVDTGDINLYFAEVLNGILEGAAIHRQNITVFSIASWGEDAERVRSFCDGRVDGMILLDPLMSQGFAEELAYDTTFVAVHGDGHLENVWNLEVDNEDGAYQATRHLIEHGHRDIGHFSGPLSLCGPRERLAGYRRALEEAGIAFDPARVFECYFSTYGGEQGAEALLRSSGKTLPTALFCASDAIAIGCMERLAEAGVRVPHDISLAGFDDALNARMTLPRLTTVRQPLRLLGHRAVEILLQQIAADQAPPEDGAGESPALKTASSAREPHTIRLPVELVARDSVARPATQDVASPS